MLKPYLLLGLLALCADLVVAQSLSNCHSHGTSSFCVGPDGKDVPVTSSSVAASTTSASTPSPVAAAAQTAAVTACQLHQKDIVCVDGEGKEVSVGVTGTPTGDPPAQFTGCHSHGDKRFCVDPQGNDVPVAAMGEAAHDEHEGEEKPGAGAKSCHFHAGVEHCVGADGDAHEDDLGKKCAGVRRDYNIPLRIGALFAILVTCSIGVFGPMALSRLRGTKTDGVIFTVVKQFGTGVIFATAFVHLLTHAQLTFANPCLGELSYEATASALFMAGAFLSFLIEYGGSRVVARRGGPGREECKREDASDGPDEARGEGQRVGSLASDRDDRLSVVVMEAGIVFHSILIGVTLVVAGDSGFVSLFVVIIFHQMFEGLALGARIAALRGVSTLVKLLMASGFAVITPLGMAIGLGVLQNFNGNDRSTIVAIGTLDALSAGILAWAAIVDMWARDWLHGSLRHAGPATTAVAMAALVLGTVLMSLLGKWA
ncbi:MAG: hypothetical protein M1832_000675 [Thelocarpon impressellum]|nr:MAG: hypothetical protein M1832_000675 [Thelocarpon impressellum]